MAFPSSTETNPKEFLRVITLKSEEEFEAPKESLSYKEKELFIEDKSKLTKERKLNEALEMEPRSKAYVPRLPFPRKIWSEEQKKFREKFLTMLKKLHIDTSLFKELE